MKKKNIKKIAKKIYEYGDTINRERFRTRTAVDAPSPSEEPYSSVADFNQDVSDRFYKFVTSLLNYPSNIGLSLTNNRIEIYCEDIKDIKKHNPVPSSGARLKAGGTDLRIYVSKETFTISYGYSSSSTSYRDIDMYSRLYDDVKNALDRKNIDTFTHIWEYISKESGLLRDSNLDEILN